MLSTYGATRRSCYRGYLIQAVIASLAPILFIVFQTEYGLVLGQISILIFVNFASQLVIDFVATKYVDRIGYRTAAVIAHVCAAVGLVMFGAVPLVCTNIFAGLIVAIMFYAVGGGFIEVLISPIIDALPSDHKHAGMSFLHSFNSWGQVLVVLLTTLFIKLFGNAYWFILPFVYALIPALNLIAFLRVPLPKTLKDSEKTPIKVLLRQPIFWIAMIVMTCAGASELIMSQWASLFAERGLGVSKFTGDLLGPCAFALFMALGRMGYGLFGEKLPMRAMLIACGALCVVCYLVTALVPHPIVSLLGCALTGLAVSLMWPGMLAETGANFPRGGTTTFGILAIMGDLGCTAGPSLIGIVAETVEKNANLVAFGAGLGLDATQTGLRAGILIGTIFPLALLVAMVAYARIKRNGNLLRPCDAQACRGEAEADADSPSSPPDGVAATSEPDRTSETAARRRSGFESGAERRLRPSRRTHERKRYARLFPIPFERGSNERARKT